MVPRPAADQGLAAGAGLAARHAPTAAFAAQVVHDIAAVAELAPDDDAMLDAFEQIAAEDLRECG